MKNRDNHKMVHFFVWNIKLPKYLAKKAIFTMLSGIAGMLLSIIFVGPENTKLSFAIIILFIILGSFLAGYFIPRDSDEKK